LLARRGLDLRDRWSGLAAGAHEKTGRRSVRFRPNKGLGATQSAREESAQAWCFNLEGEMLRRNIICCIAASSLAHDRLRAPFDQP
jgi:hypothetical protein